MGLGCARSQDHKRCGDERGAVNVVAPLTSARTSLQLAFGPCLLLATLNIYLPIPQSGSVPFNYC